MYDLRGINLLIDEICFQTFRDYYKLCIAKEGATIGGWSRKALLNYIQSDYFEGMVGYPTSRIVSRIEEEARIYKETGKESDLFLTGAKNKVIYRTKNSATRRKKKDVCDQKQGD